MEVGGLLEVGLKEVGGPRRNRSARKAMKAAIPTADATFSVLLVRPELDFEEECCDAAAYGYCLGK